MAEPKASPERPGLLWRWPAALRGALYALPGGLVALHDPGQGLSLAVGVLPAAALGLLPTRRARPMTLVAGLCVGLLMLLQADPAQAHGRFNERVTATVVGVALAYLFGLVVPRHGREAG